MGLFFGKKSDKKAELSKEEIGQLKQQLDAKMAEYRAIYSKLVESGGAELPESILESVTGGMSLYPPTSSPPNKKVASTEIER